MAITLKQIAEECGVSTVTVSRILTRRGGTHSAKTRRAVLDAARRMGYKPNASARATITGRFGSIALVISSMSSRSHMPSPLVHGIEEALEEHDVHLTIARLPDETLSNEGYIPKFLRQWMVDGLLVNYTHDIPSRMIDLITSHRIPAVWLHSRQPTDCVYKADMDGARRVTRRLLSLGHRKVAYADYYWGSAELDHVHGSVFERQAGYEQVMREAGLPTRVIRPLTRVPMDDRQAYALSVLAGPDRPTAIVCYWIDSAVPTLLAAKALGMVIPRDLSIMTFSNEGLSTNCSINFSGMLDPDFEMGFQGVQLLWKKLQDPNLSFPAIGIPLLEATGSTCGPPPPPPPPPVT